MKSDLISEIEEIVVNSDVSQSEVIDVLLSVLGELSEVKLEELKSMLESMGE